MAPRRRPRNAIPQGDQHDEAPVSVTDVDAREPPTEPHIAVADPFEVDAQLADIGESAARADQIDGLGGGVLRVGTP